MSSRERSRTSRDDRGGRDREERSGRSSSRGSSSRGGRYEYQSRGADSTKKRGDQSAGDFDRYFEDGVKPFKPNAGNNFIRFLPPTWDNPEHFGMDIFVHYSVGPDNQTYLCLHKMKGESCPICEERAQAQKDGDEEYAKKLEPKKRVLVYLIDRDHEKEGVQVWAMPWTVDRDICKISVDKRSGDVLELDNPEDGYDIEFEKKGAKDRTEYIGTSVARRSSPLGNDDWLDYVVEHPLDTILKYYDYDHIAKSFGGSSSSGPSRKKHDDDDDGDDLDAKQERGLRESEDRGRRGSSSSKRDEPELDWDSIHDMTFDEMCALVDEEKLDIDPDKSKSDEDLADWICEEMKIEEEKKPARRSSSRNSDDDDASPTDRLSQMRKNRERR